MYYGNMTPELEKLYDEYYKMFNSDPDEYIELEYGANEYKDYVRDIKKALKLRKELPDIVIKRVRYAETFLKRIKV